MNKRNTVKVLVRTRPTAQFAHGMIDLLPDGKTVDVHCKRDTKRGVVNNQILDWSFRLDGILHNASQESVYQQVAADVVSSAFEGYNGTLMCYGQTGAGKTFTMTGVSELYKHRGLIPRAIGQIYSEVEDRAEAAITIRISYLEIYNETMYDLLATVPDKLESVTPPAMTVVEDGTSVYVKGLSCHLAQNEEEALNLLFEGETNRAIAQHQLNTRSSRSHCIFTIHIEKRSRVQSDARYTQSKINLVDLAGSERLSKTQSEGKVQQEAMYINKSLTFLEQIVIALAEKKRDHVPFRQSKLTHCLKDSIGGSSNTTLIANIWGEQAHIEETISTLRFASRMMIVKMEPVVQEHMDPIIVVRKLEKEILSLKRELAMHDTLANRSQISYEPLSEQQRYEIKRQVQQFIAGSVDEVDIVNVRQIQGAFECFKDIFVQVEQDVENRLRVKYMLIDKTDPANLAAAQHSGGPITDDDEMVGDLDGTSFSIGQAPSGTKPAPSSVVSVKKKEKEKKGRAKDRSSPSAKVASPVHSQKALAEARSSSLTPSGDKHDRDDVGTPTSSSANLAQQKQTSTVHRASTPPPRGDAFEDFKKHQGSEINRILVENKKILVSKKKSYADLAQQLNVTKGQIDKSRVNLERLKSERESQGPLTNNDGDIIITEEEFMEIHSLKDLKQVYRVDFEELKNVKTEIVYCQKLVDQTRQRLISEFDKWYGDSFLPDGERHTSAEVGFGGRPGLETGQKSPTFEEEQEKLSRLQMMFTMDNPDSIAFYNAKLQTKRRKTYQEAMRQSQPCHNRKPGTPTRKVRNAPPTQLYIQ